MENTTIENIENEIVEEFSFFDNWEDKYEYIIDLGKGLKPMDAAFKTDGNKVAGCVSQVWLHTEIKDGRIYFNADSDAIITKGLVGLLVKVLSNQKPEDVANAKLEFLDKIGMKEHLSPTRSNGLVNMIKFMKRSAERYVNGIV
ncbi:MAG: SufE family protein [Ignavibacteriae bacterium]|nr:SufE family protein [Ignavibacteriota bacterium]